MARTTISSTIVGMTAAIEKLVASNNALLARLSAPATSAPVGTKTAASPVVAEPKINPKTGKPYELPFVQALEAKREAKLASGAYRECPNCGKAISVARSVELCKDCYHATPAQRKARAR